MTLKIMVTQIPLYKGKSLNNSNIEHRVIDFEPDQVIFVHRLWGNGSNPLLEVYWIKKVK